jgi:TonB family protein
MLFDLEDHRPDTPRVPSAISVHAGVLLSLVIHAVAAAIVLFTPLGWFEREVVAQPAVERIDPDTVRYVEMRPLIDRQALAKRPAEQSDMDRRSATRDRAADPDNAMPLSRGDTPEKIEDGRAVPRTELDQPEPGPDAAPTAAAAPAPPAEGLAARVEPQMAAPPAPPQPALGQAFRNLQRYLQDGTFHNPTGGDTEQSADIQFDARGADFGPWLRRFKAQVERNWILPAAAVGTREHSVVIQFSVLSNGTIVDLRVVQPAALEPLTTAALNALRLSNPTAPLPPDYPSDRVLITVTFRYYLIRGT